MKKEKNNDNEKSLKEFTCKSIISVERIEKRIFLMRNKRVMIDKDLADLYNVPTKVLNQAVKRNIKRFPSDFMFILSESEKFELVTKCDHLAKLKYSSKLPYAFTEQCVAMLSSVLNREKAIMINIQIMRTFIRLNSVNTSIEELKLRLNEMEKKYDKQFKIVFQAFRKILDTDEKSVRRQIGFRKS